MGEWPQGLLGAPRELGPLAPHMDALLQSRKPKLLIGGGLDEVTAEDLFAQCFELVRREKETGESNKRTVSLPSKLANPSAAPLLARTPARSRGRLSQNPRSGP